MMNRVTPLSAILVGAFVLAGCSSADRIFGLDRNQPDEFAVVSRAPLSMRPEFNLRPPHPGAPRPQAGTAPQRAETVVCGTGQARVRARGTVQPAQNIQRE